jgi:hypothetical protein|tara:strand:- start:50 stop:361 length:312 start_codon:yes stop_codon:yes gene_type:complete
VNTSIGDNPYILYTPSLVNWALTIKERIMSKTFDEADTKHKGTRPIVSVSGSSPEKSGVMFDLTPRQQEYARELLAEGVPKSKVIQMIIEDSGEMPRSRVIAI